MIWWPMCPNNDVHLWFPPCSLTAPGDKPWSIYILPCWPKLEQYKQAIHTVFEAELSWLLIDVTCCKQMRSPPQSTSPCTRGDVTVADKCLRQNSLFTYCGDKWHRTKITPWWYITWSGPCFKRDMMSQRPEGEMSECDMSDEAMDSFQYV